MGRSNNTAESSKKASGQARKAEAAARKKGEAAAQAATAEDADWAQGSKSSGKKEEAAAKKAEAARKKAERDALLAAEEQEARAAPKATKSAARKGKAPAEPKRGLDLGQLDDGDDAGGTTKDTALAATGIDDALDALAIAQTGATADAGKVDRHPERRVKAAYATFEARRLPELEKEHPGLRRNQRVELCRKEFEKSDENPFNRVAATYDASKEDVAAVKKGERERVEGLLGAKE